MRVKIISFNLIAVLVVGLAGCFVLRYSLAKSAEKRLAERMETAERLFDRSEALRGFELLHNVTSQAMSKETVDAFAPVEIVPQEGETQSQVDAKIRDGWFKKCVKAVEFYSELLAEKTGKKPELLFVTDRHGVVIARNTTPQACPVGRNVSKAMPVVARALDGQASYAIWSIDDSPFSSIKLDPSYCQLINTGLLELAAAPVWYGDSVAGAMVIGFEVSNGTAKNKAELTGLEVAVLKGERVYSSSLGTDKARQALEKQIVMPEVSGKIAQAVKGNSRSGLFKIEIEGEPFLAIVSPFGNSESKDRLSIALMGSLEKEKKDLGALWWLVVLTIVGIVIVLVAGVVLSNHFLKPVMEIEEGLLKVINGDQRYRFDIVSSEVGGLGYRINQLIGVLTGEEETKEESE